MGLSALFSSPLPYHVFISHPWDASDEYSRVVEFLNADRYFDWKNISVPVDQPLQLSPLYPKSHRTIVRQLDEKISQSDCLLVLAGMYVAHRGWIQSEIEAAKDFNKPIVAVAPRGQERFPKAVMDAADEQVGWNGASMISAIRRISKTVGGGCQPAPHLRYSLASLLGNLPVTPEPDRISLKDLGAYLSQLPKK